MSTCHCKDDKLCNPVSGFCDGGLCADGWQGNNCSMSKYKRSNILCHQLSDVNVKKGNIIIYHWKKTC